MKYKEPPMKWNTGQMQFEPDLAAIKNKKNPNQEPKEKKKSDLAESLDKLKWKSTSDKEYLEWYEVFIRDFIKNVIPLTILFIIIGFLVFLLIRLIL